VSSGVRLKQLRDSEPPTPRNDGALMVMRDVDGHPISGSNLQMDVHPSRIGVEEDNVNLYCTAEFT